MPTVQEIATTAAKGIDTEDFLDHIAWTAVIRPKLDAAKAMLTKQLVDAVLSGTPIEEGTRERIAGKIHGIDYVINEIESIVKKGREAEGLLRQAGISLQDIP
jgi:hypothetical protein